jgi:hypothetical protein
MTEFQQCSYRITTSTYQRVLDLTIRTEISGLLCQALANISDTCPNTLQGWDSQRSKILDLDFKIRV